MRGLLSWVSVILFATWALVFLGLVLWIAWDHVRWRRERRFMDRDDRGDGRRR